MTLYRYTCHNDNNNNNNNNLNLSFMNIYIILKYLRIINIFIKLGKAKLCKNEVEKDRSMLALVIYTNQRNYFLRMLKVNFNILVSLRLLVMNGATIVISTF